jgi:hypothetical protein
MRAVAEVVSSTAVNVSSASVIFGLLNVRSAVKKAALIHDTIADHHLDIAVITESWIQSDAPNAVKLDIAPPVYRVHRAFRGSSANGVRGGGIAVVFRENIDLLPIDLGQYAQFELQCLKMVSTASTLIIVCLYRPPGSVSTDFCSEMCEILDHLI